MARKQRAVQTFIPVMPRGLTHNDLEAYTVRRGSKITAAIRKGEKLRRAESKISPYIEHAAPSRPLSGKIRQRVKYCFPVTAGHYEGEPMAKPPDLDNMTKVLNDLCERFGWLVNDASVVDVAAIKVYSEPHGIFVRFEEI